MKKLKKHLSVILIFTLILTLCPLDFMGTVPMQKVSAEETSATSGICGENVTWELVEDTEVEWDLADGTPYKLIITGSGEMADYGSISTVPWNSYIETITSVSMGDGVTTIGNNSFRDCVSLVSVAMPESLISIGDYAFSDCYLLESITIPDNVISIGTYAFYYTNSLKNVTFGENLTSIGDYAFCAAFALESVTLGENVESLGNHAFDSATSLKEVTLNEKLVSIGEYAFWGNALTSINIPASVSYIGSRAFAQIFSMESITVSENNQNFKIIDGILYEMNNGTPYALLTAPHELDPTEVNVADGTEVIDSYAFDCVNSIRTLTLPDTLKKVGASAFFGAQITNLELPDSVEYLGSQCFASCSELESVSLGKNLQTFSYGVFNTCRSLNMISCSAENEFFKVEDNALYSKDGTVFYLYPAGRTDEAFHMPDDVTTINGYAIYNAKALTELYLPKSLQILDKYAISNNNNLKSIYFYGNAPTADSPYAVPYENSDNLILYTTADATGFDSGKWTRFSYAEWNPMENLVDEGTLGDITWTFEGSIGRLTLNGSESIPDFDEDSPAPWNDYMDSIQTIEAGEITDIGNYAFYQAEKLLRVDTDAKVTDIGDYTFADCGNLTFIEIQAVDTIGAHAFENNSSLKNTLILENVSSIGTAAFKGCSTITDITLSSHLTTLEEDVFAGCSGMVNIIIPETVNSIKSSALKGCTSLRTINIPVAVSTIGSEAFAENTALEKVYFYGTLPAEWAEDSFANSGNNLTLYYRTTQTEWENLNGFWNSIPVVGQDKFYTEQEDHYSFGNTHASFGYSNDYRIPRQRYVDALRGITIGTYYYSVNKRWGGSCYGMSASTLEFYENNNFNIKDYDTTAQNLYDISAPANALAPLTKLIEMYQVSQHAPAVSRQLDNNMNNYKKLIQRIEEFERSGGLAVDNQATPIVIAAYSLWNGHAVVPVSVEQNESGDFEIQVYDCNYPNQFHTATVSKDFSEFSYKGLGAASFIDYTTITDTMDGIELHTATEDTSVYLSIDKENVNVTNTDGQGIDEIEGAYEEIFFNNNEEDTFPGIRSFVLPEGNYTLSADSETTEESEDVTFYMASENVFAEVTSTDEDAVFEVQKADTENGEIVISLSNTTDEEGEETTEETTSITLINNTGMERTIEVTGSEAEISIAEDNENITIAVPTEETVTVDGKEVTGTDGTAELTFVTSAEENPLKVKDLTTEISCNETNALSGNVTFSLVSNSTETQNAVATVTYLDEANRTIASYTENIEAVTGTNTVTIDFENLETAFAYGDAEESLTCQVTVALLDESGVSSGDARATQNAACSITRYAKIAFDTNGGTGSYDTQYVAYNGTVAEPEIAPTRDGYRFAGWFAEGSESPYDFQTAVTRDITLTAKWTVNTPDPTPTATPTPTITPAPTATPNVTPTPTQTPQKEIKVTKVKITDKNVKIAAGKKVKLTTTISPSNATNKALTWKSSNTKYATVKNGVVTTKKAGAGKTVTITAEAKDGSGKKATIKIKIMKNSVKKVTLKAASTTVKAGKKIKITPTITTTGKTSVNKTLTWTSSNTKYATVKNGVVTTKKAGKGKKVTITATSTDGTNKKAKVTIKIK